MMFIRCAGIALLGLHLASAAPGNPTGLDTSSDTLLAAVKALQRWYNPSTGIWDSTGWWNGANCLTVLVDWALADVSGARHVDVPDIIATTFRNAQQIDATAQKTFDARGLPVSEYNLTISKRGFPGFLNEYYDDEGWWALALIRAWDLTRHAAYLDMAERIFEDMRGGVDDECGGGIWWSKARDYKNAIANELYISVGASLARRVPAKRIEYAGAAAGMWSWFEKSGMINEQGLVNDGLEMLLDGGCVNNGMATWTYNQGVLLGGLVELAAVTRERLFLDQAVRTAKAALRGLTDENGILSEANGCEPDCGSDGGQFKGIFMRNLVDLYKAVPDDEFLLAILRNADAVWTRNRNDQNQFGISWWGPPDAGRGPDASTHSSALDVVVGARAVAGISRLPSHG
ncbi:hypothetical protein VTJ04DRAFT_5594 [Mycothermus thermophilus]|uniref:uncharacterized protein n=1 Tax=Humicola insolens TaxID=85995 RepID=UPI003743BA00